GLYLLSLHDALPILDPFCRRSLGQRGANHLIDGWFDIAVQDVMIADGRNDLARLEKRAADFRIQVRRRFVGIEAGNEWHARGGRDRKSTRLNSSHVK